MAAKLDLQKGQNVIAYFHSPGYYQHFDLPNQTTLTHLSTGFLKVVKLKDIMKVVRFY